MIRPAVRAAISAYRDPTTLSRQAADPLPPGMTDLLRLLNADFTQPTADFDDFGIDHAELVAAARFFVNHVVCHDGADDFRLLGADATTPLDRIKQHRRLLLRWIHPDAHHGEVNSLLFQRLNEAWHRIERGEADHPLPDFLRSGHRNRPAAAAWVSQGRKTIRPAPPGLFGRVAVVALALAVFAIATGLILDAYTIRRNCPTFLLVLPLCQSHDDAR